MVFFTEENFEVAKRMKQAITDLQKVGEKLARYKNIYLFIPNYAKS